jgi:signal transduction histidine kinase
MKRALVLLALVLPAVGLGFWSAFPQFDPVFNAPLFHFYIVVFTTFAATVVSLFVAISVGETALPRHLLLAVAFAWMGAVFLIHGASTPNALITHFHPALQWSAWLTLSGGGAIFLVGAFAPNMPSPRLIRAAALVILGVYLTYASVAYWLPDVLSGLLQLPITPSVAQIIFFTTVAIWLAASLKHFLNYRRGRNAIDGLMAFEAGWYATATVSMFQFRVWNASWWIYHALLLAGFLIAVYALWRAYEQMRSFRLTRYYAATSLIVTAALALLSAQVYAQITFENLRTRIESDTGLISRTLATELALGLPEIKTSDDLQRISANSDIHAKLDILMADLPVINHVSIYDAQGSPVFNSDASNPGHSHSFSGDELAAVLSGQATFELAEPGSPPPGYTPSGQVYVLQTYVPFRSGGLSGLDSDPIGALMTLREAPELTQAMTLSRQTGLGLAALSLGGLFLIILFIIRRADHLITSRTRELEKAYANLRQAEGMRDDLTNMIVHDLRNPLTAVMANLDLIGKAIQTPNSASASPRFLTGARASGQRMMGLIDDLLNVSKFEAGELRPVMAPVHLPALLTEKAAAYQSQAEKEHKTLGLNASADLPTVMADAGLISRVIDNLLNNAFKYTEAGGKVELNAELNGASVRVCVCDDGEGIPLEYQTRIFEKFVQVTDRHGVPLRKGAGLGLAFCRLAVEAHGGKIWVESTPGHGSTFYFTLPLNGR